MGTVKRDMPDMAWLGGWGTGMAQAMGLVAPSLKRHTQVGIMVRPSYIAKKVMVEGPTMAMA